MSRSRSIVSIVAVAAAAWSCSDSTTPPTPQPTTIQLDKTSVTLDALGATAQLTATVLDQDGEPMSGQQLTWTSSAEAVATVSGSGVVTAAGNGSATVTVTVTVTSGSVPPASAAVTVAQVVTQLAKVGGDAQSGEVGLALAQPITVEAQDRRDQALTGSAAGSVSVGFAVTSGAGSVADATVTLDANGRASTMWTLGTTAGADHQVAATVTGGTLTTMFSATPTAGAPATVLAASGDAQTGTVATALGNAIVIHVEDQFTNPAAGIYVGFAVTQGGGSVSADSVQTDANGDASVDWTLGNAPGPNEVTYTVTGVAPGTVTATGQLGPPFTVAVTGGDAQNAPVNTAVATAPTVQVTDVGGNPLSGETVTFVVTGGSGSVSAGTPTTDGSGNATVGSWTLGTTAGANELTATAGTASGVITATGDPGPATSMAVNAGDGQTAIVGTVLPTPPSVVVTDAFGNAVSGESIAFTVTGGAGSVTGSPASSDTSGIATVGTWTLGGTPAANTLDATGTGLPTVTFTATGVSATPDMVVINAGDNQTGLIGVPVNIAPSVLVTTGGLVFAGATVTFTVTGGGGSVMSNVVVTGSNGIAQVGSWTLGAGAGANTVDATVTGGGITGNPVTFTATGQASQFSIVLQYTVTPTAPQQAAFDSAAALWSRILIGELADVTVSTSPGQCGPNDPGLTNVGVEELHILVTLDSIDGPGAIIGSAGPCFLRSSGFLPYLGQMTFDTADLASIDLERVALHEMAHVLGFGTLWGPSFFNFLVNPSLPSSPGVDTYFSGPLAQAEFDSIGGTSYTGGAKVPVENTQGGQGTRDGHWRESVFDSELLTGFTEQTGTMPLSTLTIASMEDMGYLVNLSAGESYSQVFTLRAGPPLSSELRDEIWRGPIFITDARGRVIRVVRPRR